jgi:muramidase (phage lysozyme)
MPTIKIAVQIAAFLDLIAWSEGTSSNPLTKQDGYDVIVSGVDGHHTFTDCATHPFALGRAPILVKPGPPPLHSTASGRYQLILPTWEDLAHTLHLGTFSPTNQDLACVQLLHECHADYSLYCGQIEEAIERSCETWASFPGNLFKQGGRPMPELMEQYTRLFNNAQAAQNQRA